MQDLGKLEPHPVRKVWPDEASNFTPWLADPQNLPLLGDAVGLSLTPLCIEHAVGPYYADIVCTVSRPDGQERRVVVENQFGRSDHAHLGQLLTYAAGVDAYAAIWIAEHFTDEHRAAIDWLNEDSKSDREFWALEIEVWLIGESLPAPRFNVVAAPNPVTTAAGGDPVELSAYAATAWSSGRTSFYSSKNRESACPVETSPGNGALSSGRERRSRLQSSVHEPRPRRATRRPTRRTGRHSHRVGVIRSVSVRAVRCAETIAERDRGPTERVVSSMVRRGGQGAEGV